MYDDHGWSDQERQEVLATDTVVGGRGMGSQTHRAEGRREHGVGRLALRPKWVVGGVQGQDILVGPRVVQAPYHCAGVEQFLEEIHQHHAATAPCRGASKQKALPLLLSNQLLYCPPAGEYRHKQVIN